MLLHLVEDVAHDHAHGLRWKANNGHNHVYNYVIKPFLLHFNIDANIYLPSHYLPPHLKDELDHQLDHLHADLLLQTSNVDRQLITNLDFIHFKKAHVLHC